MDFDIARLFTAHYFLDRNPGGDFLIGFLFLAFFIALLFVKPVVQKLAPDNKYFRKSIRRRLGKFIALGIVGLILVSARFSAVLVFSMRLWLYAVLLTTVVLGVLTFLAVRKEYGLRLESVKREKQKRGIRQ